MKFAALALFLSFSTAVFGEAKPLKIDSFQNAADYIAQHLDVYDNQTAYCRCEVDNAIVNIKSCNYQVQKVREHALKLEFVQIVRSEVFGPTFSEWKGKSAKCLGKNLKGLDCARTNPEFMKMESDLYNIFPESAEISEVRGSKDLGPSATNKVDFGCGIKSDDLFEPAEASKGPLARAILNFQHRYPQHVKLSRKQMRLYKNWDKLNHVTDPECRRFASLAEIAGYKNLYASRCNGRTAKNSSPH